MKPIGATGEADDGAARTQVGTEQHDVFGAIFNDSRVVDGFDLVRNVGLREDEDRIVRVTPNDIGFHGRLASRSKIRA